MVGSSSSFQTSTGEDEEDERLMEVDRGETTGDEDDDDGDDDDDADDDDDGVFGVVGAFVDEFGGRNSLLGANHNK